MLEACRGNQISNQACRGNGERTRLAATDRPTPHKPVLERRVMAEKNSSGPSKVLRGVAVTLMGLTVLFTLLGGAGTTCVAFGAEKYGSMASLVPYKPLYQALVVISLAVGIWGIPVTIALVRGGVTAYRNALLVLLVGALTAGIQMGVSQIVRGASAPVNVRFTITAITLAIFLLLRLPPLWERVDFTQPMRGAGPAAAAAGTALVVCGIITLATPVWAGPTHMSSAGSNWVNALQVPLTVSGWGMMLAGILLLIVALGQSREGAKGQIKIRSLKAPSKSHH